MASYIFHHIVLWPSLSHEFHAVLGQYLNYQTFTEIQEPDRTLYLAVARNIYDKFFLDEATQLIVDKFKLNLIVIDAESKTIESWITRSRPIR